MIVYGTKDVSPEAATAPVLDLGQADKLEFTGGQILQVISELTFDGFERRLPPALHPTHPPYGSMTFYRVPDSRFGPFAMAQVRVSALAGISRFNYSVGGWTDNEQVAAEFGRRYGYRLDRADVTLARAYDRVWGTVTSGGRVILEAGLFDPEPVAGADANYQGHLNLATLNGDLVLAQTGPQLAFQRCERGRPQVTIFSATAIGCDAPYWPVSAFTGQCDFLFSPVTVACQPAVPAVDGAMSLNGPLCRLG